MDPLSDIVSVLHPHDCVAAGFDAGGDWAIRFERHEGLKCNAVLKGVCYLAMDGLAEPMELRAGDCVILPHGRPFVLASRQTRIARDAGTIYVPVQHGGTAIYGGGGDFYMAGSRFLLSGSVAQILLDALPLIIVLRHDGQRDVLR